MSSDVKKRIFTAVKAAMAVALLAEVSLGAWVRHSNWPSPDSVDLPAKADVIVVLGGGGEERVRMAYRLFSEGRAKQVLVTGDGGLIVSSLKKSGVPDAALIHESQASTTYENAVYVKPMLDKLGAKTAILVTSWSHAQRAERIFRRLIPEIHFFPAFEKRPAGELSPWEKDSQERERRAALYCFVRYGIWCF